MMATYTIFTRLQGSGVARRTAALFTPQTCSKEFKMKEIMLRAY